MGKKAEQQNAVAEGEFIPKGKTEIVEYQKTESALADLRSKYSGAKYDLSTTAGMTEAKEARRTLIDLRVDLEKERERIKAPVLERGRLIDAEAKRITAELLALEKPIDEQIKAEEKRKEDERAAKAKIEADRKHRNEMFIRQIREFPAKLINDDSKKILMAIEMLGSRVKIEAKVKFITEIDNDFQNEAVEAFDASMASLDDMLARRVKFEEEEARIAKERAELEELRRKEAERMAEEKRIADEARAEADRIAKEERDRLAAEERGRAMAEAAKRHEAEAEARRQREEAQRAADQAAAEERARIAAQEAEERAKAYAEMRAQQEEIARQQAALAAARRKAEEEALRIEIEQADLRSAAAEALEFLKDEGYELVKCVIKLEAVLNREVAV